MQRRALAMCLARWAETCEAQAKTRETAGSVVRRMQSRAVCVALDRWREAVAEALRLRRAGQGACVDAERLFG